MPRTKRETSIKANGAPLGFEEKLWAAADKMRGHMDAAEYKHVVLGLVFLKYISDALEERHAHQLKEAANPKSDLYVREERACYAVAEDSYEYTAANVFWMPKLARWSYLWVGRLGQPFEGRAGQLERDDGREHVFDSDSVCRGGVLWHLLHPQLHLATLFAGLGETKNISCDHSAARWTLSRRLSR